MTARDSYPCRIVAAASLAPGGAPIASGIPCRRRPNRRQCPGWLAITRQEVPPVVRWSCPRCGDGGEVRGWKGGPCDLTDLPEPEGDRVELRLTDDQQRFGFSLEVPDAALVAIFLRLREAPRGSFTGQVPERDLEELDAWLDQENARLVSSSTRKPKVRDLRRPIAEALGRTEPVTLAHLQAWQFLEPVRPPVPRRPRGPARPVRVKATLKHVRPPIWRRLVLPGELSLVDLHEALQVVFGWMNGHLHGFRTRDRQFGDPEFLQLPGLEDESGVRVADLLRSKGDRLVYDYDFGAGWEHDLVVEEVLDSDEPAVRCLGGRRAGPPEDCGGPWGYGELLQALRDPGHERHGELVEWMPLEFDPEEFDLEDVEEQLRFGFGRG